MASNAFKDLVCKAVMVDGDPEHLSISSASSGDDQEKEKVETAKPKEVCFTSVSYLSVIHAGAEHTYFTIPSFFFSLLVCPNLSKLFSPESVLCERKAQQGC